MEIVGWQIRPGHKMHARYGLIFEVVAFEPVPSDGGPPVNGRIAVNPTGHRVYVAANSVYSIEK